ncbi:MAG: hypothetical protein IRZ03_17490 [Acidobacterium ailaaui]|nr:hypothetical protein [Pseudacidobacterium ailaaui]
MNRYDYNDIINDNGYRYRSLTLYPYLPNSVDDIYIQASNRDRLDIIAYKYYGDSSLWWIIAMANPDLPKDSLYISPGTLLRIPNNQTDFIKQLKAMNS